MFKIRFECYLFFILNYTETNKLFQKELNLGSVITFQTTPLLYLWLKSIKKPGDFICNGVYGR